MYLESRESPTTIWRLDPIVAAAISSGMVGQLIRQMSAERHSSLETGMLTHGESGHDGPTKVLGGKWSRSAATEASGVARTTSIDSSGNRESRSSVGQMGGVPSPAQTIPNNSENSSPADSHGLAWESNQFAEGLEALFNSGAPFEDPFGAATDHSRRLCR
jgi:hypothetical protein